MLEMIYHVKSRRVLRTRSFIRDILLGGLLLESALYSLSCYSFGGQPEVVQRLILRTGA